MFEALPCFLAATSLPAAWFLAPVGAVLALLMALVFYRIVMKTSEGDEGMVRVAQAVRDGAIAYLRSQRNVVAKVFLGLIVVLLFLAFGLGLQEKLTALGVAVAGTLSGLCGWFGMRTATNASARTANAAKHSLNDGLKVAFRAGAVMGLCVTGFALLDISVWFFLLTQVFDVGNLVTVTTITLSFAMGASLQALFARVGGGIYTKGADVGADLVGKVEAGIPEDDARNPATIADNVGDNVGDVAGMGADLYESYYGSILAAMALAAAAAVRLKLEPGEAFQLVSLAPALAGLGIIASILSIFLVRTKEDATFSQLLKSLHMGVWGSSAMILVLGMGLLYFLLGGIENVSWLGLWGALASGLVGGLVIAWGTELYTSYEHGPVQRICEQTETGPATVIISGIAEGMRSTWIPLLTIVVAILLSFTLAGGGDTFLLGVLGVAIGAVGMLSTLSITLATDAYGPIADNAGGNAEMTHQEPYVRERTDKLDSLGNTTAATGKGFAIGSAALTALALLAAYVMTVQTSLTRQVQADVIAGKAIAYHDHGVFQLVEAGKDGSPEVDAGLLNARDDAGKIKALLEGGAEPVADPANPGRYSVSQDGKKYAFDVVKAGTATLPQLLTFYNVTLMNPQVLCGLFLGVMLVFLFCSMTMNAVGRAAYKMMQEARRQFGKMREAFKAQGMAAEKIADPTSWPYEVEFEGNHYPDYASCVSISTAGALREMLVPSLMAVAIPIGVGLVLGVAGVMGLLAGALVCGFAMAIYMANTGGAWDNAKKYIESGKHGGKGSANHKAAVVGDTVGDPFKDTSGPSMNILIKLVSVVSIVFCGLVVKFSPMIAALLGIG